MTTVVDYLIDHDLLTDSNGEITSQRSARPSRDPRQRRAVHRTSSSTSSRRPTVELLEIAAAVGVEFSASGRVGRGPRSPARTPSERGRRPLLVAGVGHGGARRGRSRRVAGRHGDDAVPVPPRPLPRSALRNDPARPSRGGPSPRRRPARRGIRPPGRRDRRRAGDALPARRATSRRRSPSSPVQPRPRCSGPPTERPSTTPTEGWSCSIERRRSPAAPALELRLRMMQTVSLVTLHGAGVARRRAGVRSSARGLGGDRRRDAARSGAVRALELRLQPGPDERRRRAQRRAPRARPSTTRPGPRDAGPRYDRL